MKLKYEYIFIMFTFIILYTYFIINNIMYTKNHIHIDVL